VTKTAILISIMILPPFGHHNSDFCNCTAAAVEYKLYPSCRMSISLVLRVVAVTRVHLFTLADWSFRRNRRSTGQPHEHLTRTKHTYGLRTVSSPATCSHAACSWSVLVPPPWRACPASAVPTGRCSRRQAACIDQTTLFSRHPSSSAATLLHFSLLRRGRPSSKTCPFSSGQIDCHRLPPVCPPKPINAEKRVFRHGRTSAVQQ
jgi:hypothetical protein